MVDIEVLDQTITVKMRGLDELWCLRSRVSFDIDSITKIYLRPSELKRPWFRTGGTYFPGIIAAGRFRRKGDKEFWLHKFSREGIVFELEDSEYKRVVVDVREADTVLARLSELIEERWGKDEEFREIEVEASTQTPPLKLRQRI